MSNGRFAHFCDAIDRSGDFFWIAMAVFLLAVAATDRVLARRSR